MRTRRASRSAHAGRVVLGSVIIVREEEGAGEGRRTIWMTPVLAAARVNVSSPSGWPSLPSAVADCPVPSQSETVVWKCAHVDKTNARCTPGG